MRPVNLIPADQRRRGIQTAPVAYLVVGGLAVALAALTLVVLADNKVADSKTRLSELRQEQAAVSVQAEQLAPFVAFSQTERNRTDTVRSLANSRFDWERVLRELSLVLPDDVSLNTLTGSVAGGDAPTDPAAAAAAGPSLEMAGCANGHEGVAAFLGALRDIDGVDSVNLSSSAGSGSADAATAPASDAGGAGCGSNGSVAEFQLSVEFDAPAVPAAPSVPAAPQPAPTSTEAAPTSATTDGTGS